MGIKLIVVGGKQAGMEIPVRGPKFLIGRGEGCHLRTPSHTISRKHCLIRVGEEAVTVEDCGSTNGTLLNGEKINAPRPITTGDHIKVGILELEVRLPTKSPEPQPKASQTTPVALRPTAVSAQPTDDLEISKWLADDDDEPSAAAPPAKKHDDESKSLALHDTIAGKPLDDTTTTMSAASDKKTDKKEAPAFPGRFKQPAKPKAESSRSAAEEMLRQFFPRKK